MSYETLAEPVVVTSSDDEAVIALASLHPERRSSSRCSSSTLPLPIDNCDDDATLEVNHEDDIAIMSCPIAVDVLLH